MTPRTGTWLQSFFPNAPTWMDKEWLTASALFQRVVCHLKRERGFSGVATCPLPGCRCLSREIPEPFLFPPYSLLPTSSISPTSHHWVLRAEGHQTIVSRREKEKDNITHPYGRTVWMPQSTATQQGWTVTRECHWPAWGDSSSRVEQKWVCSLRKHQA